MVFSGNIYEIPGGGILIILGHKSKRVAGSHWLILVFLNDEVAVVSVFHLLELPEDMCNAPPICMGIFFYSYVVINYVRSKVNNSLLKFSLCVF